MKIKFLGVGAALNTDSIGSSILVDDTVLIDVPPASPMQLLKHGVDIKNIKHIFVSHLHGDHYCGLPFLLLEYLVVKRDDPLYVYGSDALRSNTIKLLKLAFEDCDPENLISSSNSTFRRLLLSDKVNTEGFNVIPVTAKHSIETFGFKLIEPHKTIYYSSDTEFTDDTRLHIEDSDIIIIDATTRGMALPGHIDLNKIIECAQQYSEKVFFITHRSRYYYDDVTVANIVFPDDGDEFSL